jgi:uncharacterized protein YqgC (DUF456 family)
VIQAAGALLLVLMSVFLWALNLVSLPGNWLVVVAAAMYAYFTPADSRADLSVWTIIGLIALAAAGEGVEFLSSSVGTRKAGGSRRSAVLALCGSFAGGLFGLSVGLPIPVVGSMAAALLFGGLGALGGAVLGEQWKGRTVDHSLQVGEAAFWGRLFGSFGKAIVGAVMLLVICVSLVL